MDGRRDSARTRRMPAAPASPRSTRRPCPSPTATESTVVRFRWWRKAAPRSARLGAHCRRTALPPRVTAAHRRDWKKRGTRRSCISNPRTGTTGSRSHGPPGKSHPKPPTRTQPWSRATSALLPPARSSQPTRMAGFGAKVDMVRTHEQQPTRRRHCSASLPGVAAPPHADTRAHEADTAAHLPARRRSRATCTRWLVTPSGAST